MKKYGKEYERKNRIMMAIRMPEETKEYIERASAYHGISMTDFIIKQCLREEFVVIDFENINELLRLFSNVSNNINQIARILNIANKKNKLMSNDELIHITKLFEDVKIEFEHHLNESNKTVKEIYQLSSKQKKRKLDDEYENE